MLYSRGKSGYACLLLALTLAVLLCGCYTPPQEINTMPPVTTPSVRQGLITDTVSGRFAVDNGVVYCAAQDSILRVSDGVSLVALADAPEYLCAENGRLVYRQVYERENFAPVSYQICVCDELTDEPRQVALGNITYCTLYNNVVLYIADDSLRACNLADSMDAELARGEFSQPCLFDGALYLGYNGSLCRYVPGGEMEVLAAGCAPVNITADESGVYYSTEMNAALIRYDAATGESSISSVENMGLTLWQGVHYYVKNDGGFYLHRADTDAQVLYIGQMQNCSAPCFTPAGVYFFIQADDYYGPVLAFTETGEITRLSGADG